MATGRGKRLPKRLERAEARQLMESANPRSLTGLRSRAILETLYRSGVRVAELCALAPEDVLTRQGGTLLHVRHGKGDKERFVPINETLAAWLARWMEKRPEGATLFVTHEGGPLSPRYVQYMVKRHAAKAGIRDDVERPVTPHVLRHTYASERLEEGFTVAEVAALLGHSPRTDTGNYLHASPAALAEKVRAAHQKAQEPAPEAEGTNDRIARLEALVAKLLEERAG